MPPREAEHPLDPLPPPPKGLPISPALARDRAIVEALPRLADAAERIATALEREAAERQYRDEQRQRSGPGRTSHH